jgi:hypothetical protein
MVCTFLALLRDHKWHETHKYKIMYIHKKQWPIFIQHTHGPFFYAPEFKLALHMTLIIQTYSKISYIFNKIYVLYIMTNHFTFLGQSTLYRVSKIHTYWPERICQAYNRIRYTVSLCSWYSHNSSGALPIMPPVQSNNTSSISFWVVLSDTICKAMIY